MATANFEINDKILKWVLDVSGSRLNKDWKTKISKWLGHEKTPTIKQIQDLSNASKIPFGYLFLNEPPKIEIPLLNFRTVDNDKIINPSAELIDTINEMESKSIWLEEYRKDNGMDKIPFVGMGNNHKHLNDVDTALKILEYFSLSFGWNVGIKNQFRFLRNTVTNYGITVNINSVVKNTKRRLDQNEFRAFLISNDYSPLIFINSRDSFNARLFSLTHELVHLWYGKPELLNFNFQNKPEYLDKITEQKINLVVENILLPKNIFIKEWHNIQLDEFDKISKISRSFGVSEITVAIRAKNLKFIKQDTIDIIKTNAQHNFEKEQNKNKGRRGGPDFYTTLAFRTDNNFANNVINSVKSGKTSYTDAFDLLNVKGTHGLSELMKKIRGDIK